MATKMEKARAALIMDHPFFASLLLPMPMIEDNNQPTMATDGETILFNSEWIEKLTDSEILFVLAHETLHCALDHMGRRGDRDPSLWNQAADYAINEVLCQDRVGTMPKIGLRDTALFAKGGGTAEGIYPLIPNDGKDKKPGESGGSLDHISDYGSNNGKNKSDQATLADKSAQMKVRVLAAKNIAKMSGTLSAGIDRLVTEAVKPKVDWREVLRRFVTERAKVDFSFARPKRRFVAEDLYLPSLTGERMGKVVVAVDCSGSISGKLLASFAAEINAIREDLKPSGLDVIYFDSRICKVDSLKDEEELVIKPVGGGGTAFSPVINYVNSMQDMPACVVFLTDLECNDFGKRPDYPVLWCVLQRFGYSRPAPYGEVVQVGD